jgi:hypothetical protein
MLEFPDELLRIPDMLRTVMPGSETARGLVQAISPEALSEVLSMSISKSGQEAS